MTLLVLIVCGGLAYFVYKKATSSGQSDGTGSGNNPPNGELPPTDER